MFRARIAPAMASIAAALLIAVACTTVQPTPTPTTSPQSTTTPTPTSVATQSPRPPTPTLPAVTPSATPSAAAPTATASTAAAACTLDPVQSDAAIVGCVTLANDTSGNRDGTYEIVGVASEGSDCSASFDGTEFTAVAWNTSVPEGQVSRLSVSVPADNVPQTPGVASAISGRVSFDFAGAFVGGTYTGDASQNDGQSTIDIALAAGQLTFDFDGVTAAGATFTGAIVCA